MKKVQLIRCLKMLIHRYKLSFLTQRVLPIHAIIHDRNGVRDERTKAGPT